MGPGWTTLEGPVQDRHPPYDTLTGIIFLISYVQPKLNILPYALADGVIVLAFSVCVCVCLSV